MKKTKNIVYIVSILIITVMLITFKNSVFAANTIEIDGSNLTDSDEGDIEDDSEDDEEFDDESDNGVTPQPITISNSNNNNNTSIIGISNTNNYQTDVDSMPKTGIKENVEIVIIAGVVSSFYFYRKYKKYYKL